jgi:tryptophan 2,3-dioxygenase
MSDADATPPPGGSDHPTVEDSTAKEVLGHGDLQPILPGPGDSDYERYLRTDELLRLQKTPDEMLHRDEALFQTVHQSSELWLKLAVFETEEAIARIGDDDLVLAVRLLGRANHCVILVTDALHVLERLSPWEYHELRKALGHGSGFDSPGWRRLRRLAHPLWDAFAALLERRGLELSDVYTHEPAHPAVYDLAEALIEFDERIAIWRSVHVKMVQRVIGGGAVGTQGTPVAVLAGMTTKELFPELWRVRNRLTEIAGG